MSKSSSFHLCCLSPAVFPKVAPREGPDCSVGLGLLPDEPDDCSAGLGLLPDEPDDCSAGLLGRGCDLMAAEDGGGRWEGLPAEDESGARLEGAGTVAVRGRLAGRTNDV